LETGIRRKTMEGWKVKLMVDEFPFLGKIGNAQGITLERMDKITVERGDSELLNRNGCMSQCFLEGIKIINYEIFFAVYCEDGEWAMILLSPNVSAYDEDDNLLSSYIGLDNGAQISQMQAIPSFIVEYVEKREDQSTFIKMIIHKMEKFDFSKFFRERQECLLKTGED